MPDPAPVTTADFSGRLNMRGNLNETAPLGKFQPIPKHGGGEGGCPKLCWQTGRDALRLQAHE